MARYELSRKILALLVIAGSTTTLPGCQGGQSGGAGGAGGGQNGGVWRSIGRALFGSGQNGSQGLVGAAANLASNQNFQSYSAPSTTPAPAAPNLQSNRQNPPRPANEQLAAVDTPGTASPSAAADAPDKLVNDTETNLRLAERILESAYDSDGPGDNFATLANRFETSLTSNAQDLSQYAAADPEARRLASAAETTAGQLRTEVMSRGL